MTNNIVIVGASGFGREVAWLIERINEKDKRWNIIGFVDDNDDVQGTTINGYPVIGKVEELCNYNGYVICAIGSSTTRKNVIKKIDKMNGNVQFATIIDPSVQMSKYVDIGKGCIICANTILTTNIKIGDFCTVNLSCTIGHDSVLEDYVTVYPSVNISGNTHYGKLVELGTGTQIIQGKKVGSGTIVGAGSVVVKDLPENCTAVGIPAKPIKFHEE